MKTKTPTFPFAGQPDIVRCVQKDEYHNNFLHNQMKDVISWLFGSRIYSKYQNEIKTFSHFLYYFQTTVLTSSTLGEEYCDIMQINASNYKPPNVFERSKLVFVHTLFPYIFDKMISIFLKKFRPHDYRMYADSIRNFIPFISRFHLALFYMNGKYLDLSKRVCNIRYVFTGKGTERPNYKILGIFIFFQQIISLLLWIKSLFKKSRSIPKKEMKAEGEKCNICFEPRNYSTATSCGHLFCWDCICDYLSNNKTKCPICRSDVALQNLVRIYHYHE